MSKTKGGRSRKSRKRYRKLMEAQRTYVLDNAQSIKWIHMLQVMKKLGLVDQDYISFPERKTVSVSKVESRQDYYSIDWKAEEQRVYREYRI